MKKVCFIVIFLSWSILGFSQKLKNIDDLMGKFQYKAAKEAIDKFLVDPKNASDAEALYYKGRIYNSLSRDSTQSMEDSYSYKSESFSTYKKLQEIDKLDIRLKLENYISYFDLYNGLFDIGAKAFNQKKFELSFNGFKTALLVEEYIRSKGYEVSGFKFPVLDTSLVLNTAIAAKQAKNEEAAEKYYKTLADANLKSENNIDIYLFLAEYYYKKKDKTAFSLITAKAKNFYPAEPYWEEAYFESVDIENATKGLSKEDLIKKYDEMVAKYPNNYASAFNYSVELYKYMYAEDTKPAEVPAAKAKFEEVLKRAIAIRSTPEGNFLMANFLYNNAFDLTDEAKKVKGVKPEDVKKRNELNAASKKSMENCVPFAMAAADFYGKMPKLKAVEKSNYKQCYEMLSEIYRVKGDAAKSAEYKAKKEAI